MQLLLSNHPLDRRRRRSSRGESVVGHRRVIPDAAQLRVDPLRPRFPDRRRSFDEPVPTVSHCGLAEREDLLRSADRRGTPETGPVETLGSYLELQRAGTLDRRHRDSLRHGAEAIVSLSARYSRVEGRCEKRSPALRSRNGSRTALDGQGAPVVGRIRPDFRGLRVGSRVATGRRRRDRHRFRERASCRRRRCAPGAGDSG